MKKILISITLTMFLTSCAETMAFLGPASTAAGGGNVVRSSLTSAIDYGIKKSTGKSSLEHAVSFAEKHNPDRKKVKCVNFLEASESELCSIIQKRVTELKNQINKGSKIKTLD